MTTTEPNVETTVDPDAVSITVNGRRIDTRKGELLIKAAQDNGEYIPRFCYHERMEPVGMCRMCLVEVDTGRGPQLVPSCMVTVAPGMVVETESPTAKKAQEGVIELLLANHPLDCPVCDKGGECPLQDQSYTHGPGESRYIEEKRHFEKPIPISPLVLLDRERCILCDRCTRFADEVAGDPLIEFTQRGNITQIATFPDEPFSSYFSGNTVQICPVGALTASPYRFKARPWDLSSAESTCTECAVGCRTVIDSSRDEVLRVSGVDGQPVNWGWLCDRGRFGFRAVESAERIGEPMVRTAEGLVATNWNAALTLAATLISEAKAAGGAKSIAVLGGARGTNEDAFAWARLAHDVIGTPNVSAQLGDGLPVGVLGMARATIDDVARASTIILLAPDLKEELPVLYLRVRDAVMKRGSKIVELTPKPGGLTRYAWRSVGYEPGGQVAAIESALADPAIAAQLATGDVAVVVGRANLAESSAATVHALQLLRSRLPGVKILPALRRGNVVGALQLGLRPGPGGLDSKGILKAAANGEIECLILLGTDPLSDFPDADLARRALAGARRVVAVDTFVNASSRMADIVLAASAHIEKAGTTTNIEGRVTAVAQKVTALRATRPDWMIAAGLAAQLGDDLELGSVEAVTEAITETVDWYADVTSEALEANPDGVLAAVPSSIDPIDAPPLHVPARNSYDFRLVVSRTLYDQGVAIAHNPALAPLAAPAAVYLHPLDLERAGVVAGADVKLTSAKASVILRVEPDPTVLRGTAWAPFNRPGNHVGELIDIDAPVTDVRIENI